MPKKKIIWAVDIFGAETSLHRKSARMVNQLSATLGASVVPTYVMSPIPALFRQLPTVDEMPYAAETPDVVRMLEDFARQHEVKSVDRCVALLTNEPSVRREAEVLIRFARAEKADLIVLGTHARKTVERFFLGSFAETMVLRSPVPLMVVQPTTEQSTPPKDIIFPTDFSEKSKRALAQVETLALASGATIHLFHHMEYMTPSVRDLGLPSQSRIEQLIKQTAGKLKQEKTAQGETWAKELTGRGIEATSTISEALSYIADDVLEFTNRYQSAIVAVASQSEPGLAEILGGIARRLVRQSPFPVWVVHPLETKAAS